MRTGSVTHLQGFLFIFKKDAVTELHLFTRSTGQCAVDFIFHISSQGDLFLKDLIVKLPASFKRTVPKAAVRVHFVKGKKSIVLSYIGACL